MSLHEEKNVGRDVQIVVDDRILKGILVVPGRATGVVAFAHGSGSGRLSSRNQYVARVLNEAGLATLLLDLLDDVESDDRAKVFDIDLLAERLAKAAAWLRDLPETAGLRLGFFGASTGAAAALVAASWEPQRVEALVSRGGRPDLAGRCLKSVRARRCSSWAAMTMS